MLFFPIPKSSLFNHAKRQAQQQGGLLSGVDPSSFTTSDPLRMWIIQLGVIILITQLLSLLFRRIKQPKVIAEVIGGILLGPTAFGRIPGFSQHIFPQDSIPYLTLVADIGLCLFLFLVGLEIDTSVIRKNARISLIVSLAGIVLPFGLGVALSVPLYHEFVSSSVKFTYFMLFTGVAYSITAFPVLCRILTELKLLDTTVGVIVLSAGVGNDVVGWTLLALSVALVNASSGLTALWILLTCVAWVLFLLFIAKRVILWLAIKTGSIENGPTMFFMTVTIIVLFGSAFFTDIIGVNAIFGAFLAGIIVPRDGGLAIALTEKLEDMVSVIFLPLYFTLSGLNTNLGLINDGIAWGFTIAICAVSFSGKFGGCTIASKLVGFGWREASTIGSLMSCKGLVELIVLNVGLDAGILSQKVFSMFVFEAVLLTFMTTPLVIWLYPSKYRVPIAAAGVQPMPQLGNERSLTYPEDKSGRSEDSQQLQKTRFTVVLDKLEHLPGAMAITQLIRPHADAEHCHHPTSPSNESSSSYDSKMTRPSVDAFRLIELSDRTSAVMKSSVADKLLHTDPLLGIFRMFGELNNLAVTTSLAIVTYDDLADSVINRAVMNSSQLILIPWLPPSVSPVESTDSIPNSPRISTFTTHPFEALFGSKPVDKSASVLHSQFVRKVFSQSTIDVALFVDCGGAPGESRAMGSSQHIFFPFFGGPDDRLALDFIVQLCNSSSKVTATIIKVVKTGGDPFLFDISNPPSAYLTDTNAVSRNIQHHGLTVTSTQTSSAFPDTVYGHATTQTRLQSETADNVSWSRYTSPQSLASTGAHMKDACSRIRFEELATSTPLRTIVQRASALRMSIAEKHTHLLIVTGRSRRMAPESHFRELKELVEESKSVGHEIVKTTIGDIATAFVVSGCKTGLAVFQASAD